jgi:(4S)-4-hydroxy-5-phosphonooxypentane-2,3-dione isomerase
MTRLAILVDFRVRPEARDDFRRLVAENGAASLKREPGCQQFDILVPEAGPEGEMDGRFLLYEIYADAAAFDAHLHTEHYRQFEAAVSAMVAGKTVSRLRFAKP